MADLLINLRLLHTLPGTRPRDLAAPSPHSFPAAPARLSLIPLTAKDIPVEQLLLVIAVLACPVSMGLMMWFMMRGRGTQPATPDQEQELARLRAQIEALRPIPAQYDGGPRVPRPDAVPEA